MLDMLKELGLFIKWVALSLIVIFMVVLFVKSILVVVRVVEECC
jgi:hypothetical protein